MPLVASTSTGNPKLDEWTNKLVGKTIHDDQTTETAFCKRELPQPTRVIKPGMMVTKDFKDDRLNVHVDDTGVVSHVTYG